MKTIDEAGWGEIWDGDLTKYDSANLQAVLDHEAAGVRFDKINSYLRNHLGGIDGRQTVEIGCGGAIYSLILAQRGAHTTLLDYSSQALSLAKRNLQTLDIDAELLETSAFELPSDRLGQYDVAMSFGTVEHYRYPFRKTICQTHLDLIRPGGVVIISTPNILFLPHEILKRLLALRGKWFLGYEGSFSRWEFARMARQLGLRDIRIVGSSWRNDLQRYIQIVRETNTFRGLFAKSSATPGKLDSFFPQVHHWLDDYLGHEITLLGVKASS